MLRASKQWYSVSISGPSARAKPMRRRIWMALSLTMVRGCSPPAGSWRAGSVRSMPAIDFWSARFCSSRVFDSSAVVMAARALLSAAPKAGLSSLAMSFMPAAAAARVPFFPRNATRASSRLR